MSKKRQKFDDDLDADFSELNMSDEDLDALIDGADSSAGGASISFDPEIDMTALGAGSSLEGIVIDVRGDEVLLELDSKNHGIIEEGEFDDEPMPQVGDKLKTSFVRYDKSRDLAILSVKETLKEIWWDSLHPGLLLEGLVTGKNKGGLTLTIKNVRAFMPMSQIELGYVEDPSAYIGKKLKFEVVSFDRSDEEIVVSRRALLKREADKVREKSMSLLQEGEVVKGKVVRINQFGAFIDVGGVEGLLHKSKIADYTREAGKDNPLQEGQSLEVEIARIDADRGRIALNFRERSVDGPSLSLEEYSEGDKVVCWVNEISDDGAIVTIDDSVKGFILNCDIQNYEEKVRQGAVLNAEVTFIDRQKGRIEVKPLSSVS